MTLHSLCLRRLTLACISRKISTKLVECWLILTGLPSLLMDPISCQLVSSAVRCRLPTALFHRPSPTPSSGFLCPTTYWRSLAYFRSRRDLESTPFVWFRAKTDKGIVFLADHLNSVTRRNRSTTSQILTIRRILEGERAKTYRWQYYTSISPKPSIPFTEGRWNKSY